MPVFDNGVFDSAVFDAASASGSIEASFPAMSAALLGVEQPEGTIAATFPKMTAAMIGIGSPIGDMAATFPKMTAALSGYMKPEGDIIATFPKMTAVLSGSEEGIGVLRATFPGMSAVLSGWEEVIGTLVATFPRLGAVIVGSAAVGDVIIRVVSRQSGVFIHSPWWPGERVWEIASWSNLNRHWQRFQPGNADVDVASSELAGSDYFREGFLLVVIQANTPVWAGPMLSFQKDNVTGITRIDALGLAALLDGQDARQDVTYKSAIASGGVFRALLSSVNRLAHTGIYAGRIEPGPSIRDLQVGGQSAWQSFEELHARTNNEYWLDIDASASHLRARINWGTRQGYDLSDSVHLWEGQHFGALVLKRDMTQQKAAQTAIGDFGAPLAERNSVTVLASGKKVNNGAVVQRSLHLLPPGLRNTRVFHVPMTGNSDELEREARRAMLRPLNSTRTYQFEVPTGVDGADWLDLQVGNYVTLHPEGEPEAVVRVVGYSPDAERGSLELVAEEVLV